MEIPAGTLDANEAPRDCAIRELQEETSYYPNQLESLGSIYAAPGYTTELIHLFLATDLANSSLDMDEDEFIEVKRIPFEDALHLVESGEIADGKTVAGLLRVARHLGI